MSILMRSRPLATLLVATLFCTFGCGGCDEEGKKLPPPVPRPDVTPDLADDSTDQPDVQTDEEQDTDESTDQGCIGEDCDFEWESFDACERVRDLGTLQVAQGTYTNGGNTIDLPNLIATSCSNTGEDSAEYIFRVTFDEDAQVELKTRSQTEIDFVTELRMGTCDELDPDDPDAPFGFCRQDDELRFRATAGTPYYIVVEAQNGTVAGPFDFNLTMVPSPCVAGDTSCDNDDVQVCLAGTSTENYACGTSCDDALCASDQCADALEISGTGTTTYTGNLRAYFSEFDAQFNTSCVDLVGFELPTPGADQFFSLKSLVAGQRVIVDAAAPAPADQHDNAIFVLDGCGASAMCLAYEESLDRLEWIVPADGDYTVVIDHLTNNDQAYTHTIVVEDP